MLDGSCTPYKSKVEDDVLPTPFSQEQTEMDIVLKDPPPPSSEAAPPATPPAAPPLPAASPPPAAPPAAPLPLPTKGKLYQENGRIVASLCFGEKDGKNLAKRGRSYFGYSTHKADVMTEEAIDRGLDQFNETEFSEKIMAQPPDHLAKKSEITYLSILRGRLTAEKVRNLGEKGKAFVCGVIERAKAAPESVMPFFGNADEETRASFEAKTTAMYESLDSRVSTLETGLGDVKAAAAENKAQLEVCASRITTLESAAESRESKLKSQLKSQLIEHEKQSEKRLVEHEKESEKRLVELIEKKLEGERSKASKELFEVATAQAKTNESFEARISNLQGLAAAAATCNEQVRAA